MGNGMRLGKREGGHLRGHEQAYANEIIVSTVKHMRITKGAWECIKEVIGMLCEWE